MRALDLFDLSGKTAIITGGATGLGRQMAEALGECGARLVLCARNEERCVGVAAELANSGIEAVGMGCDVTDAVQVQAVVDRTLERFGHVDVLVNNAGTSWK